MRACYLKGLVERPTTAQGGALPVSFQIQPDGTVRGAGVSGFVDVPSNTVELHQPNDRRLAISVQRKLDQGQGYRHAVRELVPASSGRREVG